MVGFSDWIVSPHSAFAAWQSGWQSLRAGSALWSGPDVDVHTQPAELGYSHAEFGGIAMDGHGFLQRLSLAGDLYRALRLLWKLNGRTKFSPVPAFTPPNSISLLSLD